MSMLHESFGYKVTNFLRVLIQGSKYKCVLNINAVAVTNLYQKYIFSTNYSIL